MSELLRLDAVSVDYGATRAVNDASLTVGAGEIVGVVGESGSGKTTLGRAIAGFVPVSAGSLHWEGAPLPLPRRRPAELRRDIQMVFQDPYQSLNPRLTAAQTLGELLRAHGLADRASAPAAIDELLARVELTPELGRVRPSHLSGGQRQRVAIARALAVRPRLIVADEPTSALDVSVQAAVLALFASLRATLGTALVVITHDLSVVERLSDTVVVMKDGAIVEQGPTARVLASPAHPYTRRLLDAVPRLVLPERS
ncbi:ATP-binding cassette domain-containing protein [Herbiconiux moechotypicola]|uniref:ABC transporter domain-containing protein n=1 Tax=Herbiconiux moechotypicola TaxID=637393 RepID=A0ABN3D8W9_9MICO|nr:ATP-binding cassette domain-containing protein [Herbiconiux moechotypicola]MCS5728169.1 ATP-binding cassette domain-containing protein [Herbiconiux moechotypicola]